MRVVWVLFIQPSKGRNPNLLYNSIVVKKSFTCKIIFFNILIVKIYKIIILIFIAIKV